MINFPQDFIKVDDELVANYKSTEIRILKAAPDSKYCYILFDDEEWNETPIMEDQIEKILRSLDDEL